MFLVRRQEDEGVPDTLCFVQAKTIGQAKEMVSTPKDVTEWAEIPNHLVHTLIDCKEGYMAFDIHLT